MTSIIAYDEKVAAIRRYLALQDKRRISFSHPEGALLQVRLPMAAEDCSFTLDSEELHNLMSEFSETEAVRDLFADFALTPIYELEVRSDPAEFRTVLRT